MREKMTIGRLAATTGVSVETVRFYQRSGLIEEPPRPTSGYRHYSPDSVRRIRFIKRAQALGFTLEEISILLRLDEANGCAETRELAVHKLALIERKLADLTAMREALTAMVGKCDASDQRGNCPIIQTLVQDSSDEEPGILTLDEERNQEASETLR